MAKPKSENLTQSQLKNVLKYSKSTGLFTRKLKGQRTNDGKVVGCLNGSGNMVIGVNGNLYVASRLAVLYVTGKWPDRMMEYNDLDRTNNKWANLRYKQPAGLVLTQARLRSVLEYDPASGAFTARINTHHSLAGEVIIPATTTQKITVDGMSYHHRRLAFLYMNGYMPENDVSSVDRNRANSQAENIRESSRQCTLRNSKMSKNNTSGVTGVSFRKADKKWLASIKVDYKQIYIGIHVELEDAVMARWKAEVEYGWPNCNSSTSAYLYLKERNLI